MILHKEHKMANDAIKPYPACNPTTSFSTPLALVNNLLTKSITKPIKRFPITLAMPINVTVKVIAVPVPFGYLLAKIAMTVG